MARIICEVRPRFVFVENSPMLTSRGLDRILGDLASMGFNAKWGVLGASSVGANHKRERIWIRGNLADTKKLLGNGSDDKSKISLGRKQVSELGNGGWQKNVADTKRVGSHPTQNKQIMGGSREDQLCFEQPRNNRSDWWEVEPDVGRVADGVAARVDRLKAIGNGQVSEVARTAWEILSDQR